MKNKGIFYKIYFSLLILFAILLVAFLICLEITITEYNKGIPETVSENFFNDTFLRLDTDKIIEMSGIKPSEFETQTDIKNFLQSQLSGELTYTNISFDGADNEKKYIVKSGEYKLATFTLTADENNDYFPSGLQLHLPGIYQKTYKILNSTELMLNGIEVSTSYITDRQLHKNAQYLPEGVLKTEWITYTVTGLTKEPEVAVKDRNGNTPVLTEIDGILCEEIIYDTDESGITDTLLTAAKEYAKCMQYDIPKSQIYQYFEKGTELYESIRTVENMFVWEHDGYEFEDVEVSEFMRYDENTVSVRISFTHVLKKAGREDYRDITDITFFAHNIDGQYLIFARYNN